MDICPLVSIVMPAYNCEKYIGQAIASVEKQTYQNWELLVIDDCSADRTWSIMQELADEKIFVYHNEVNSGVAKTRNRGVAVAKGEWIAFLDSDDLWEKDKLKEQIDLFLKKKEAEFIFTASGFINETGDRRQYILQVPQKIAKKQLLKQNIISCSSVLLKKKLLQKHPFPDRKVIHEDFAVWLEILNEIPSAYGINKPLLTYRLSNNSKSGNKMRAAQMNWNTYRYVGLTAPVSLYYECIYAVNGMKKYINLRHV